MDRPRHVQLLRVTWSVAWGVGCLLLVALWVRSYTHSEGAGIALSRIHEVGVFTVRGRVLINVRREDRPQSIPVNPSGGWSERILPENVPTIERNTGPHVLGFGLVRFMPGQFRVRFPYWFAVLVTMVVTVLPWVRWRFGLRALLVAMTVVAMGLGWAAYVLRN